MPRVDAAEIAARAKAEERLRLANVGAGAAKALGHWEENK